MRADRAWSVLFLFSFLATAGVSAQSPRVLYTWAGTGNTQGWFRNFGNPGSAVALANDVDGELTVTETGTAGTGSAITDDFNRISEASFPINAFLGGIDLTGLSSLELDVGHNGPGPVNVQFFVQASPASSYVALGPDLAVTPGVNTYSLPLAGLTPAQIVFIRTIGMNIRDHLTDGNLIWTLREVRSAGTPLLARDFATHEPGSSDSGLQGAIFNFDLTAVEGNDGGQNQSGLIHNTGVSPPGNTGSLRWVDLAAGAGAAPAWFNGTALGGNTYNERPTDMSNYSILTVRMAATNRGGNVASVDVQYYLQRNNFSFIAAGGDLTLPADGEFHDLTFPIAGITGLDLVDAHGLNLRAHAGGDLIIDVDRIRAGNIVQLAGDCNQDGRRNLSDALCYVGNLFPGFILLSRGSYVPPCAGGLGDAGNLTVLDIDGTGGINVGDAVYLIRFLFGAGGPPVQGTGCFRVAGCPVNVGC